MYRQDAFGIRTRFPFGFFEKTRTVASNIEITIYPRVQPADQFYEVLPLLSGEMASYFRGRGHELHSLRNYQPNDSARFVDWKVTAKTGRVMVREFAREDERRVMLVLDPFIGPARADLGPAAEAEHAERFERAVSMAACIAWHFHEINSVMQFRTDRFSTPMATAGEIIYDTLRELALVEPDPLINRRNIPERARKRTRNLQNHNHQPPASRNPQFALVLLLFRLHRHPLIEHVYARVSCTTEPSAP